MTKSRHILPPRKSWSGDELALLRRDYGNRKAQDIASELGVKIHIVYAMAKKLGLKKSSAFLSSAASGRTSNFVTRGAAHRFKKGWPSARKGRPFPTRGRTGLTQFKKGQAPHNARYHIGDRRVNSQGYLDRKISSHRLGALNWMAEHRLVWIEANGPIPPGHLVSFKPRRHTTELAKIIPDALELVSREEHMRRYTVHNLYPKEIAQVIQLRGALIRQINKRERARR